MTFAIMLQNYQHKVRPDEYAVHFHGTFAECRAYETLPGEFARWAKSDFSSVAWREPHDLGHEPGGIYEMVTVAEGRAAKQRAAALAAGGFAAGVALAFALHGPVTRLIAGRRA